MKTFKELCDGKVWRAVEAMLTGLEEQDQREDFEVDMSTFIRSDTNLCFGCAATCAIQNLTRVNFTLETARAANIADFSPQEENHVSVLSRLTNTFYDDFLYFEHCIDSLRIGKLDTILEYFDKENTVIEFYNLPRLMDNVWRDNLQPYRELLTYLKERDI